jgi:hypothetical protein
VLALIPAAATVANPLDYTAMIWGDSIAIGDLVSTLREDPAIGQVLRGLGHRQRLGGVHRRRDRPGSARAGGRRCSVVDRLAPRRRRCAYEARLELVGEVFDLSQPEVIGEHVRELDDRGIETVAQPRLLLALRRRASVL